MLRKRVRAVAASCMALVATAFGGAVDAQVQFEADAVKVELSGRFQMQLAGSSCSDFNSSAPPSTLCSRDVPVLDMFIRRARLTIDVQVNEWISGRFQPDFSEIDDFELKDAWGMLDLQPGAETSGARIRVGHFKRPFDGFQLTSSTQILTIERDLDIAGIPSGAALSLDELATKNFFSGRDVGVMLDGGAANDRFHYWVGAFNGEGETDNRDTDNAKQFVARARVKLTAGAHPLTIAAAGVLADIPFLRADESLDSRQAGAFELFAELGDFEGGAHVQAGVILGKNRLENRLGTAPDLEAGDPLANMVTWQAIGSWKLDAGNNFFLEAVEPLFRVTMADPNRDLGGDTVWGFTPGVQIFFDGRNKLALNWDFVSFGADGVDSENSFKAQYQFHF